MFYDLIWAYFEWHPGWIFSKKTKIIPTSFLIRILEGFSLSKEWRIRHSDFCNLLPEFILMSNLFKLFLGGIFMVVESPPYLVDLGVLKIKLGISSLLEQVIDVCCTPIVW